MAYIHALDREAQAEAVEEANSLFAQPGSPVSPEWATLPAKIRAGAASAPISQKLLGKTSAWELTKNQTTAGETK